MNICQFYVRIILCLCVCVYVYAANVYIYVYVHVEVRISVYVRLFLRIHVYVCTYVCMYTCTHVHMYFYVSVYIHLYILHDIRVAYLFTSQHYVFSQLLTYSHRRLDLFYNCWYGFSRAREIACGSTSLCTCGAWCALAHCPFTTDPSQQHPPTLVSRRIVVCTWYWVERYD
jgi:hypothetical protein